MLRIATTAILIGGGFILAMLGMALLALWAAGWLEPIPPEK